MFSRFCESFCVVRERGYRRCRGGSDNLGRDHNPYGLSIWLAGGGVKDGQVIGATDEIGLKAIAGLVHIHGTTTLAAELRN